MKLTKRKELIAFCTILILMAIIFSASTIRTGNNASASASGWSRTAAYTFTPIAGTTNCSVKLKDKTITRAVVTSEVDINGTSYIVTEVALSGFASTSSLKDVRPPDTIKKINISAFQNCINMRSITILAVENIQGNAFSLNPSLEYIIIPQTVTTIGSIVLRNNNTKFYVRASSAPNTGWTSNCNGNNSNQNVSYGSDNIPNMDVETVEISVDVQAGFRTNSLIIEGGIILESQPFMEDIYRNEPIVVPATYEDEVTGEELPIIGIANYAF